MNERLDVLHDAYYPWQFTIAKCHGLTRTTCHTAPNYYTSLTVLFGWPVGLDFFDFFLSFSLLSLYSGRVKDSVLAFVHWQVIDRQSTF